MGKFRHNDSARPRAAENRLGARIKSVDEDGSGGFRMELDFDPVLSRRSMVQLLGVGGALLTGTGLAQLLGPRAAEAAGGEIERLTLVLPTSLRTLGYLVDWDIYSLWAVSLAVESLVRFSPDDTVEPALAASWTNPEPNIWLLNLREGIRFWNGNEFTSEDAEFGIRMLLEPSILTAQYLRGLVDVEKAGKHQVKLTTDTPRPLLMQGFGAAGANIQEAAFWREHREDFGTQGVGLMGTGPFRLESFQADGEIRFTKNDDYWGEKPAVKELILQPLSEAQSQLLAVRSGTADGILDISPQRVRTWEREESDKLTFLSTPSQFYLQLFMNVRKAFWSDVHVRRAAAYAIDPEIILNSVLDGRGRLDRGQPMRWMWSSWLDEGDITETELDELYASINLYEPDMDKAREELAMSGYPDGFSVGTLVPSDFWIDLRNITLIAAEMLAELGIELELIEVPSDTYWGQVRDYGFTLVRQNIEIPDPVDQLQYQAANQLEGGRWTWTEYDNPDVNALLNEQAAIGSRKQRFPIIAEAMRIVQEDCPFVTMLQYDLVSAIPARLSWDHYNKWLQSTPWGVDISART